MSAQSARTQYMARTPETVKAQWGADGLVGWLIPFHASELIRSSLARVVYLVSPWARPTRAFRFFLPL